MASRLLNFHGEESNYYVLEQVLKALKKGVDTEEIIQKVDEFLKPKRKISTELDELRIKATRGDKEAALELTRKMAEMKDGP